MSCFKENVMQSHLLQTMVSVNAVTLPVGFPIFYKAFQALLSTMFAMVGYPVCIHYLITIYLCIDVNLTNL